MTIRNENGYSVDLDTRKELVKLQGDGDFVFTGVKE